MKRALRFEGERRRYPRVMGPVLWRETGLQPRGRQTKRQRVSNISRGGVRIYSDAPIEVGQELNLEFFLPPGTSIEARARVIWFRELPPGSPGLYDVGLEFVGLSRKARKELSQVLKPRT